MIENCRIVTVFENYFIKLLNYERNLKNHLDGNFN